jgi:hypothetical protein
MSKPKNLYLGYFNTRLKLYTERVYAYSEAKAWSLICQRIAKKSGAPAGLVFERFKNTDNYKIIKEIEFKEVENVN